jgi:hypothetical protein
MAQVVSRQSLPAEVRVGARVNLYRICDEQRGTGTGFSPSSSGFPYPYLLTVTLHSHHVGDEQ